MCNDPNYIIRFPYALRESGFFLLSLHCKRLLKRVRLDDAGEYYFAFFKFSDQVAQLCIRGLEYLAQRQFNEFGVVQPFVFRVPCGKCLGCLSDRRNQWITRCLIEAQEYSSNFFITCTYNEQNVPPVLVRKHWQDFFKRLRSWCARNGRPSPREYYRGEYGHKNHRPHFHCIAFNLDYFGDERVLFYMTRKGKKVYHPCPGATPYMTSKTLENLWTHGFVLIAPVCFASVKYVAKYLDKDYSPDGSGVTPFNGMSCRPAIGRAYFDRKFSEDPAKCLQIDDVAVPVRLVQYYRRLVQAQAPEVYVKWLRDRCAIAGAAARPWEELGITELEYLQRRESRMQKALKLFGHKQDFDST